MEVEVEPILTGSVATPEGYLFRRGDGPLRLPRALLPPWSAVDLSCLAFVVRHPTAGAFLVDTGMHADTATSLRTDFGAAMALLFRRLKPAADPFDQQLRDAGVEPSEVERVVMTHLHVDHTSAMRLLPRATFVCAREEWSAATRAGAAAKGYVSHHLPPASRVEQLDFRLDGEPYRPFSRTIDLLGDGSVRLVSTRGHTAGHISLLLRVAGGRQVLLAGDAAYTLRSIEEETLPLLTARDEHYRQTLSELKAFADANPDAVVVPSHDPAAWRELRAVGAAVASTSRTGPPAPSLLGS